ncbi:hypothetical protein BDZ94DRAFT_1233453 [Collybia nuda]|uniref:Prolyl 4-hydroxylase alpha subunit Fe(2+) 2OG dioxygenase domain-containing protein n=1 Tax=Collybia nuda TaxID=64659 RepID=A0A9P5YBH4_9AGAR|nr:hypothetical protein BDZ94DRAFT_1233453 [Collybia nuda]
MTTNEVTALLEASTTQKPPLCIGTIMLPLEHMDVFYKDVGSVSQQSENDLKLLAKACDPTTFGTEQRDIFDESYRKAGEMDIANFSVKFDLGEARLIERLRSKHIRVELYKLNVNGKNSFFKAHKDTRRNETIFGSLVVVYPTRHEGGALLLRHGGNEWTFDSTEAVRNYDGPAIAYIVFYSDVEHEVTIVQSGYRVTLTYNLYFKGDHRLPLYSPFSNLSHQTIKFSSLHSSRLSKVPLSSPKEVFRGSA